MSLSCVKQDNGQSQNVKSSNLHLKIWQFYGLLEEESYEAILILDRQFIHALLQKISQEKVSFLFSGRIWSLTSMLVVDCCQAQKLVSSEVQSTKFLFLFSAQCHSSRQDVNVITRLHICLSFPPTAIFMYIGPGALFSLLWQVAGNTADVCQVVAQSLQGE